MKRATSGIGSLNAATLLLAGMALFSWGAIPLPVEAQRGGPQKAPAVRKASKARTTGGVVNRRDPFRSLALTLTDSGGVSECPAPGKRGLVIPQLTINGVVTMTTGNIAVVTVRGRNRAYFLREGDEVCKGYVDRITPDAVVLQEKATDAFGNEYEREVVKQLSGSGAT